MNPTSSVWGVVFDYDLINVAVNEPSDTDRSWIKAGEDPLRYEYGRENDNSNAPPIKDQLAYVEEEEHSPYFHWETYTSHDKGAKPSREKAQAAALQALRQEGTL